MIDFRALFIDYLVNLGLATNISQIIVSTVFILCFIILGYFAHKFIIFLINKSIRKRKNSNKRRAETLSRLFSNIGKYIVYFIVIALILKEFNVNITPILASAGIIGIAIGFGAQEIVRDFITGFLMIMEGSFHVGDTVVVDDFRGVVRNIGMRTTIIENWTGQHKIINNGFIKSIINYSKNNSTALVDFGVAYDTDLLKVQELMKEFVDGLESKYEQITEKPQFLGVTELADSSINMLLMAKTKPTEHYSVERNLRRDLVVFFNKNNIEIPFPQRVIHNAKN